MANTKWLTFCRWYFQIYFLWWKLCILIPILPHFVPPRVLIDTKSALGQVMAWYWTCGKSLLNDLVHQCICIVRLQLEQPERLRSVDTPAASWLPILLSHIGSQVKRRQSQSHKFKKIAKISILKWALHATHLLKLLDKMCKYEMDPMSILEDTERKRFCPQTDRWTDGRTDGQTDGRTDGQGDTSIPPYQLRWSGGYNELMSCYAAKAFHLTGAEAGVLQTN